MRTFEYLFGEAAGFREAALAAVVVAVLGGALSVFVVVKRLAFIGQGISHAAFGGVGVAAVAGLLAGGSASLGGYAVVGGFCIATAVGIALLSERTDVAEDTAIGIFLVGAMALGFLLVRLHALRGGVGRISIESFLFGSLTATTRLDLAIAAVVTTLVVTALLVLRRPLLFWVFDETGAEASGVPTRAIRIAFMVLLALAVVVAMRVAGVVLATALLVLPGAIALQLSARLGAVLAIAVAASLAGTLAGLVLHFEMDWPSGPSVVLALLAEFAAAAALGAVIRRAGGKRSR